MILAYGQIDISRVCRFTYVSDRFNKSFHKSFEVYDRVFSSPITKILPKSSPIHLAFRSYSLTCSFSTKRQPSTILTIIMYERRVYTRGAWLVLRLNGIWRLLELVTQIHMNTNNSSTCTRMTRVCAGR